MKRLLQKIQVFQKRSHSVFVLTQHGSVLIVITAMSLFISSTSVLSQQSAPGATSTPPMQTSTQSSGFSQPFSATGTITPPSIKTIASSRTLANDANTILDHHGDPELATLLAIRAYHDFPDSQNELSLRRTLSINRIVHILPAKNVFIPPDDKFILRQGDSVSAHVYDFATGKLISTLPPHFILYGNEKYRFTPDGKLAIGGISGTLPSVAVVNVATGKIVKTFNYPGGILAQSISPDGQYLTTSNMDANEIQIWNVVSGQLINTFTLGREYNTWEIVFSPDSKTVFSVISADSVCGCGGADQGIHIVVLESSTGRFLRTLMSTNNTWPLFGYTLSPDGQTIIYFESSLDGNHIIRMDTQSGKTEAISIANTSSQESLTPGQIRMTSFSWDSNYLLAGTDGKIFVVDVRTGLILNTFGTPYERVNAEFSPGGRYIVYDSYFGASPTRLWDFNRSNFAQIYNLPFPYHATYLASSPTNKFLAAVSKENNNLAYIVFLYDSKDGTRLNSLIGRNHLPAAYHPSITFSPDESYVVVNLGNPVSFQDYQDASLDLGPKIFMFGIATSPDGRFVLSDDGDGKVSVWNVPDRKIVKSLNLNGKLSYSINGQLFSQDGKYFVIAIMDATDKIQIQVWSTDTGSLVATFPAEGTIWGITRDGRFVMTITSGKQLDLWDTQSGRITITYPNVEKILSADQDGKYILTISPNSYSMQRTIPAVGGTNTISRALSFTNFGGLLSPDGRYVAEDTHNRGLKVWDTNTNQLVAADRFGEIVGNGTLDSLAFSYDGRFVYAASEFQIHRLTVLPEDIDQLHKIEPGQLLPYACSHVFRDLTAEERTQYNIGTGDMTCPNLMQVENDGTYSTAVPQQNP